MNDPIETATAFHLDLMPPPGTTEYRREHPRDINWPVLTFISLAVTIIVLWPGVL